MAIKIKPEEAKVVLETEFREAEYGLDGEPDEGLPGIVISSVNILFDSSTGAYREALVCCLIARICDKRIQVTQPSTDHGPNSYSGRSLSEKVVTPFLQDKQIPCTKNPFLSAIRRGKRFVRADSAGQRDVEGFNALADFAELVQGSDETSVRRYLRYVLIRFLRLREASNVRVNRIHRLSLQQYENLINELLTVQSGGLIPVLLTVAMLETIKSRFALDWDIKWQGINVSDASSRVAGDIEVFRNGDRVLTIEVTERVIDRARVVSVFETKIAPFALDDYVFFFTSSEPTEDARLVAQSFFSQGHEVNFRPVSNWVINCLLTVGSSSREEFNRIFLDNLSKSSVPARVKTAWNDVLSRIIS